jgi:hypothetical protein
VADPRDLARLRLATDALGALTDACVFVGGSITSLLLTDPASPATRMTEDVDVILDIVSRVHLYEVEQKLRARGFGQRPDNPICRWFKDSTVLDVMPLDAEILGFSNRWYPAAFHDPMPYNLGSRVINIVGPIWFLATKLAAFEGRGDGNYQSSRDIEDIIAVIDGRSGILSEHDDSSAPVRTYLQAAFRTFLSSEAFVVSIDGHLGGESERVAIVIERLRYLAGEH